MVAYAVQRTVCTSQCRLIPVPLVSSAKRSALAFQSIFPHCFLFQFVALLFQCYSDQRDFRKHKPLFFCRRRCCCAGRTNTALYPALWWLHFEIKGLDFPSIARFVKIFIWILKLIVAGVRYPYHFVHQISFLIRWRDPGRRARVQYNRTERWRRSEGKKCQQCCRASRITSRKIPMSQRKPFLRSFYDSFKFHSPFFSSSFECELNSVFTSRMHKIKFNPNLNWNWQSFRLSPHRIRIKRHQTRDGRITAPWNRRCSVFVVGDSIASVRHRGRRFEDWNALAASARIKEYNFPFEFYYYYYATFIYSRFPLVRVVNNSNDDEKFILNRVIE